MIRPPNGFPFLSETVYNPVIGTPGVSVTLGANNADAAGGVTALLAALAFDTQIVEIIACTNNATGIDTSSLLDIVIDPAGGTAWDTTNRLIQSLSVGSLENAPTGQSYGRRWRFPLRIPAGATVGAIGRNITGSDRTCRVIMTCMGGDPSQWCGFRVDAFGDSRATSGGTAIPPDAAANTYGAWTSVGSATAAVYRAVCVAAQGPTGAAHVTYGNQMQFGLGSTQIGPTFDCNGSSAEVLGSFNKDSLIFLPVPEGAQFQMRARASAASGTSNQAIIHAIR